MHIFEEKVLKTIREYNMFEKEEKVVVGVSGGPDSIALLNALYNLRKILKIEMYVAHINHSLRKEADEETNYVKEFCEKLNITCFIKKVDLNQYCKDNKIGTELAGRNIRYEFFEKIYIKVGANKIAVAHNLNDNAETVMMNLIRGAGSSGLKGIEKIREDKYIRPIIEIDRAEIENYCKDYDLEPKFDLSNNENIYTRNKIRNILLPLIEKEFNPNIIESLNRLSTIMCKQEEYFEKIVEKTYKEIVIEEDKQKIMINLKLFNELENIIQTRVILKAIKSFFDSSQGIEKTHLDDIIKLAKNNIGRKILNPNKKLVVKTEKSKLILINKLILE